MSFGRIAYEAHAHALDWKASSGDKLPLYHMLRAEQRNAWEEAAAAVVRRLMLPQY